MALWDLLGKARGEPVYRLLGYPRAYKKTPYASQLFGNSAEETLARGRSARDAGFRAVKFGWGPFGTGALQADIDQLDAAREGLGPDGILLVDAGQIWGADAEAAATRLPALERNRATWLEEPFSAGAYAAYAGLGTKTSALKMAGGEAAHNADMGEQLIDYGKVGFIQIDCGRIGGIGPAKEVVDHALAKGITFVNHTFTSHLALSASLQPYAGLADHVICEYPAMPKALALEFTADHLERDAAGGIAAPDRPGLGIGIAPEGVRKYLQDVEITVNGRTLYRTPTL
jgi:L-alanine-DL-glutamate epimerase-like enolase superfamily enzyme